MEYVFISFQRLFVSRFKGVATGFFGGCGRVLVLAGVFVLSGKFFFEVGSGVSVNLHHNHIGAAVVSLTPVGTVGDAAFDDCWHLLSPPRGSLHQIQAAYTRLHFSLLENSSCSC
jgi:hypothetical protein